MPRHRLLLAPLALAIVMLVGCKDPTGLPYNRVHAATLDTLTIPICFLQNFTGYVNNIKEGNPITGRFETHYADTIRWGNFCDPNRRPYHEEDWRGFGTFMVPPFSSSQNLPVCTLHFYVSGYYQYDEDSIQINHFIPSYWTWAPESLFKAIDSSTATLAKDTSPLSTGWHKVALTTQGCGIIATYGAKADSAGQSVALYTGWKFLHYYYDYWHTEVVGPAEAVSPYIVVIYHPDP